MNAIRRPSALVFALILSSSLIPQPSWAESPKVTCNKSVSYPNTNQKVPATMIRNTTGNLEPFIYWVEEVAGEKPQERCEQVSEIIQARFDDKTWNRSFLRTGTSIDKYPIICFVRELQDKACDPEREIIVKLKRGENAKRVLERILAIRYGKSVLALPETFFYSRGFPRGFYIDVNEFLEEVEVWR